MTGIVLVMHVIITVDTGEVSTSLREYTESSY